MPRRPIIAGLAACSLAGLAALTGPAAWARRASRGRLHTPVAAPVTPVGLVLGAQVYRDHSPSAFLRARLNLGKQLLDLGKVQRLIVSGDNRDSSHREADSMRDYLLGLGVPAALIDVDVAGYDTYDSLVRAGQAGHRRLTVISQGYHLPRALLIARLLGIDADGVGDQTMRERRGVWRKGVLREHLAGLKMLTDVASGRPAAAEDASAA